LLGKPSLNWWSQPGSSRVLTHDDVVKFQRDVATGKSKADTKTRKRGWPITDVALAPQRARLPCWALCWVGRPSRPQADRNEPGEGRQTVEGWQAGAVPSGSRTRQARRRIGRDGGRAPAEPNRNGGEPAVASERLPEGRNPISPLGLGRYRAGRVAAAPAVKLLTELPRRGDYVLPAAKGAGYYRGLQKDWERERARAGLGGGRVHDLRHSFASFAVADGNSLYLIGKVLGHKQARTTEIYAHLADDPIRAVADRSAARIAAAMTPGVERKPATPKVVPIQNRQL